MSHLLSCLPLGPSWGNLSCHSPAQERTGCLGEGLDQSEGPPSSLLGTGHEKTLMRTVSDTMQATLAYFTSAVAEWAGRTITESSDRCVVPGSSTLPPFSLPPTLPEISPSITRREMVCTAPANVTSFWSYGRKGHFSLLGNPASCLHNSLAVAIFLLDIFPCIVMYRPSSFLVKI